MLSVIIPVYNERYFIREILRRVCSVDIPKQIIIVDDASTDGTVEILQSIEKNSGDWTGRFPKNRFNFIYKPNNEGKGAAIRTGISRAEEPITLVQDADLEYDPADYPRLLEPILKGYADVVFGSRFTSTNRRVLLFWHAVGNRILTLLSNIFTNLNLTDMETGYKAFRTNILQDIPIRSNRFGFEPEITAKVAKLGCRIYEVSINYHGRTYAQGKKIGFKDALQAVYIILKYWLMDDLYTMETVSTRTLRIMEGAGKYNQWLFKQCEPFLGQRVLEMGAGVGSITRFLIDRTRVLATDVSSEYLKDLLSNFDGFTNIRVEKLDLTDLEEAKRIVSGESIDTILSMNVLEHIKNDRAALKNCFQILDEGGRLVLLVPYNAALYSDMDRQLGHYRRYDLDDLKNMMKELGFSVIHERLLNMLGALGWFVNGRIFRKKLVPSRQLRLFELLVWMLKFEKYFNLPLGLSVLIVGEKPFVQSRS